MVVAKKLDDMFMVMKFMKHILKGSFTIKRK